MYFLVQNLNICNKLSNDRCNTIDSSFQALLFICMNDREMRSAHFWVVTQRVVVNPRDRKDLPLHAA